MWDKRILAKIVPIFGLDKSIGAVSGHVRALNANRNFITKVQDSWYEGQFSIRKAYESVFGSVTCVSGPLAVFRTSAIYNFMPAWENDQFLGQEFKFATDRTLTGYVLGSKQLAPKLLHKYKDSPFMKKKFKLEDWKIVYCKSAKAYTEVPDTIRKVMKQQIRWKKSFIRNIFLTGAFYWRRPFLASFIYYAHILFVIMGPFIAFRHLIYIPLQGGYLSALLYLSGIFYVGIIFSIAYAAERGISDTKWIYRPFMSMFSTLVLSWVLIYSLFTVKKMRWRD